MFWWGVVIPLFRVAIPGLSHQRWQGCPTGLIVSRLHHDEFEIKLRSPGSRSNSDRVENIDGPPHNTPSENARHTQNNRFQFHNQHGYRLSVKTECVLDSRLSVDQPVTVILRCLAKSRTTAAGRWLHRRRLALPSTLNDQSTYRSVRNNEPVYRLRARII